jgi:hypothetical protein
MKRRAGPVKRRAGPARWTFMARRRMRARLWAASVLAVLLGALLAPPADTAGAFASAPPTAVATPVGHQLEAGVAARTDTAAAPHHQASGSDPLDGDGRSAAPSNASALARRRTDPARGVGPGDVARARAPPG